MKTPTDPRHLKRIAAVKSLFGLSFTPKIKIKDKLGANIVTNLKKVDNLISLAAPERKIDKINRIDLAILRLAVWELAVDKKNPPKAVIDEAVELAKRYGGDGSPGFVNGVLGTILKNIKDK